MTVPERFWDSRDEPAGPPRRDRAYFLDLLGDGHHGLGRHEAAIEAYAEAADGFQSQQARCSYALCLFKIAASYMSLGEPWHAHGYLEACLPLLDELRLTRHEALARRWLEACQAALTGVRLIPEAQGPAETQSPPERGDGKFVLCPGPTESRAGSAPMSRRPGAPSSTCPTCSSARSTGT